MHYQKLIKIKLRIFFRLILPTFTKENVSNKAYIASFTKQRRYSGLGGRNGLGGRRLGLGGRAMGLGGGVKRLWIYKPRKALQLS